MLFESRYRLLRIVVVGRLVYVALFLLLRVSGRRTLARLNVFKLIITVAHGSTLATVLLAKSVALVEGTAGLIVLVPLQYVAAWLSARSDWVSGLVKIEPTLLHDGVFLPRALRSQRVTRSEVWTALRSSSIASEAGVVCRRRRPGTTRRSCRTAAATTCSSSTATGCPTGLPSGAPRSGY